MKGAFLTPDAIKRVFLESKTKRALIKSKAPPLRGHRVVSFALKLNSSFSHIKGFFLPKIIETP